MLTEFRCCIKKPQKRAVVNRDEKQLKNMIKGTNVSLRCGPNVSFPGACPVHTQSVIATPIALVIVNVNRFSNVVLNPNIVGTVSLVVIRHATIAPCAMMNMIINIKIRPIRPFSHYANKHQ